MKVISLIQSWATLVILGYKNKETRSWNTKYRGEVIIHAGVGKPPISRQIYLGFQQEFSHLQLPRFGDLPFGAVIGQVDLISTTSSDIARSPNKTLHHNPSDMEWIITDQELAFGDYSPNRYAWLLANAIKYQNPVPHKGQLGPRDFDNCIFF